MFFFDMYYAVVKIENTKVLKTKAPPCWIEFDVVMSNSKCFRLCNAT